MQNQIRFAALRNAARRFQDDESGNETVQTVMIMAFGCLIMTGLYWLWKTAPVAGEGAGGGMLGGIVKIVKNLLTSSYTG